jgi:hypothetical protein
MSTIIGMIIFEIRKPSVHRVARHSLDSETRLRERARMVAFDDLRQAAVTPPPHATNKANLIEILTYFRARA